MGGPADHLGDARQVVWGRSRRVFRMSVPVADVVEPQGVVLEDFLLFRSAMRPEREAASSIPRPRPGRRDDLPVVVLDPREKLTSGLALEEPSLPMRVECRKGLRSDADRDPSDLERQIRLAHGNFHSPLNKPPMSPGLPRADTQQEATAASASSNAAASASQERHAGAVSSSRKESIASLATRAWA